MYGWSVNVTATPLQPEAIAPLGVTIKPPVSHGLVVGTRVAANLGWRSVESLVVGDKVLTFDNGVQRIVEITRTTLWAQDEEVAPGHWPVTIPAEALGNAKEVVLLPDQGVMLESETASDPMGDPFAVVPAQALEGLCGIRREAPWQPVEVITLHFASDEVIYIDGGLLIHCPRSMMMLHDMIAPAEVLYEVASLAQARVMLADGEMVKRSLMQGAGYVFGATEMVLVA
ncbi:Hint domain-containing protein [uncultured Roseobacter sp.]|uniref:Hint domain-containing protein n=1 Tax=uncultured Roseobacter sp. TaxID=114847 RepID=UPI0026296A7F|nr:Hint domain-containing protein [uncultured Roseobacter sp.]